MTAVLAAGHVERLRETATLPGGRFRRRVGALLIAAGGRLHPEAPALRRGASPGEGSHLALGS